MTPRAWAALTTVYVVWGSTYLAIRIGIESFPPLILAGLRHLTIGLLLYPIIRWKTSMRPTAANFWSPSTVVFQCKPAGGAHFLPANLNS